MKLLKSFIAAFSTYSKVPMPYVEWNDEDMKYSLCFFPWVGVLIGLIIYVWNYLAFAIGMGDIARVLISTAIPVIVTGGFHVDGYMDTMDALHSYQPKERKLEILKDSHIGAFSVIMLVLYYMIFIGAFSEIKTMDVLLTFCLSFAITRTLSGLSLMFFKPAREGGMLYAEKNSADKKSVTIWLIIQGIIFVGLMLVVNIWAGIASIICVAGTFVYYRLKSYKEFGGITGDTAGYFVTVAECGAAIGCAIISMCIK